MKKLNLKSQLLLGALLLGAGAAGAHHIATIPADDDTLYNWQRAAGSPEEHEINPLMNATVEEAQENYGCAGNGETCATGVNPSNPLQTAEIKFNQ